MGVNFLIVQNNIELTYICTTKLNRTGNLEHVTDPRWNWCKPIYPPRRVAKMRYLVCNRTTSYFSQKSSKDHVLCQKKFDTTAMRFFRKICISKNITSLQVSGYEIKDESWLVDKYSTRNRGYTCRDRVIFSNLRYKYVCQGLCVQLQETVRAIAGNSAGLCHISNIFRRILFRLCNKV